MCGGQDPREQALTWTWLRAVGLQLDLTGPGRHCQCGLGAGEGWP